MRKLSHRPAGTAVLMEDETILRLFPVLRRSWSLVGQQAPVALSGRNAQRVLFCALSLQSGKRLVMRSQGMRQQGFETFLQQVRRRYRGHPVYMILDGAGLHTAKGSRKVARELNITLIGLPKQCAELNAADQLFKSLKAAVSANKQYKTIDQHATAAEQYLLSLTCQEALLKAGVLQKNFWLYGKL